MSGSFSELIKNFDKIRDYMRDFYIYGFKTRSDFNYKSLRTYDNERRRIENWLGSFIKFSSSRKGKQVYISCDSSQLHENPLYNAYRSKSFTSNDIQLHFFILDLLTEHSELSVDEIADKILDDYGVIFEPQTIRLKLKEYISEGIVTAHKSGRSLVYSKSQDTFSAFFGEYADTAADMIKFFSESAPFGVVGNYILKAIDKINDSFLIKHNFIVHTLEDNILLSLVQAMDEKREVCIKNFGKSKMESIITGIPMKIHVSTQTGRRYLIIYTKKRFISLRLDYIKSVKTGNVCECYDLYAEKYAKNAAKCWGTSFGNTRNPDAIEFIKMTLHIDEQNEKYVAERLTREGRGGKVTRIAPDTFVYENEFFDVSEMTPWIKTFMGRIISLSSNNQNIVFRFYRDIERMKQIYSKEV